MLENYLNLSDLWWRWLWLCLPGGVLLYFAVEIVQRYGKKFPPSLRYWLLIAVLLNFVIPAPWHLQVPVKTLWLSSETVTERLEPEPFTQPKHTERKANETANRNTIAASWPNITSEYEFAVPGPLESSEPGTESNPRTQQTVLVWLGKLEISDWLFGVFVLGLLMVCISLTAKITRLLWIHFRARTDEELTRQCERLCVRMDLRMPRIWISECIPGPVAGGLFTPYVLMPASYRKLSSESQELLLLHELAHLKFRDPLVNWLQILIGVLCWWNPCVYRLNHLIRCEREHRCDDYVLQLHPAGADAYPRVLLDAAEEQVRCRQQALVSAFAYPHHALSERIKRLAQKTKPQTPIWMVASLLVLFCVPLFFSVDTVRADSGVISSETPASIPYAEKTAAHGKISSDLEEPQGVWSIEGPDGEKIFTSHWNWRVEPVYADYAPDSNMLAVPSGAGILVWDLNWNQNKPRYYLHEYLNQPSSAKQVRCIAISQNGTHVIDGKHDGTVTVYNVFEEESLYKLHCPQDENKPERGTGGYPNMEVMCLVFSWDEKQFAVGHRNGLVRILETETGKERCSFNYDKLYNPAGEEAPGLLRFSPDGNSLLIGHAGQSKQQFESLHGDHCLVDLNDPSQIRVITQLKTFIQTFAFMPDGKSYCTVSSSSIVRETPGAKYKLQAWDLQTGKERTDLSLPQPQGVAAIYFDKHGDVLSLYEDREKIEIKNESKNQILWEKPALQVNREISVLGFSHDSRFLINRIWHETKWYDHQYRDPDTAKPVRDLNADLGLPEFYAIREISADGRFGAGVGNEWKTFFCVDFLSGKISKFENSMDFSTPIKFSGNGNRVLVKDVEGESVTILNTASLSKVACFESPAVDPRKAEELNYDGRRLLVRQPGGARLIDIETGETVQTFTMPDKISALPLGKQETEMCDGKGFEICDAIFHPDGKRIISRLTYDMNPGDTPQYHFPLQIWNIETGEMIEEIDQDRFTVSMSLSRNGRWLAFGEMEGRLHLVDLESNRRFIKKMPSQSYVTFSPDGNKVLIRMAWGVQQIWDFKHLLSTCSEVEMSADAASGNA